MNNMKLLCPCEETFFNPLIYEERKSSYSAVYELIILKQLRWTQTLNEQHMNASVNDWKVDEWLDE